MKNLLLILFVFITACQKDFYYNFEHKPQVNISGFIRAGDTVKVQLTYLLGDTMVNNVLADKDYISNAEVYLYENHLFKEQLHYREIPRNIGFDKGWYFTGTFIPREKHTYQLKVFVPGYDTVYAETLIPEAVKIDSVLIDGVKISDTVSASANKELSVNIFFKDKAGQKDYYNYWSNRGFLSYDPVIESRYRSGYYEESTLAISKFAFFSDEIFDGKTYALSTKLIFYGAMGTDTGTGYSVSFKLYTLSYDAYAFYRSWYLYQKTLENPLSEPVIFYSNIKNGTGIFAGMSSDIDSVYIIYK